MKISYTDSVKDKQLFKSVAKNTWSNRVLQTEALWSNITSHQFKKTKCCDHRCLEIEDKAVSCNSAWMITSLHVHQL